MKAKIIALLFVAIFLFSVVPTLQVQAQEPGAVDLSGNYVLIDEIKKNRGYTENENIVVKIYGWVTLDHKQQSRQKYIIIAYLTKLNSYGGYDFIEKFQKTMTGHAYNDLNLGKRPVGLYKLNINAQSHPEDGDLVHSVEEMSALIAVSYHQVEYKAFFVARSEFYVEVEEENQTVEVEMYIDDGENIYLHKSWDNVSKKYFKLPKNAFTVRIWIVDANGWRNIWHDEEVYAIAMKDIEPWASRSVFDWILFALINVIVLIGFLVFYIRHIRRRGREHAQLD